jgi:hypothetical protein
MEPGTFVDFLNEEIERCERYERNFALLLVHVPTTGTDLERTDALHRASVLTRRLVRGCDLIASFEGSGLLSALLPETGPEGAAVVLDRFASQMGEPSAGWIVKLATYPEHTELIDYFLTRAEETLKDNRPITWPTQPPWPVPQVQGPLPVARLTQMQTSPNHRNTA